MIAPEVIDKAVRLLVADGRPTRVILSARTPGRTATSTSSWYSLKWRVGCRRWIVSAWTFGRCELMIDRAEFPVEIVGFHAQQCCETSLKAVLTWHEVTHPDTHDLIVSVAW